MANVTRPGLCRLQEQVTDIRACIGTPFYCYDYPTIENSVDVMLSAAASNLPARDVRFYIALFTLPNIRVTERVLKRSANLGVNCNTPEEVVALRKHGWADWNRVAFTGGVLPRKDLSMVAETGCIVNAASLGNLEHLLSGRNPCRVGLRVDFSGSALKGVRGPELELCLKAKGQGGNRVRALHAYPGTEVESIGLLIRHAEILVEFASKYPQVSEVNFGGGFWYDYTHPTGDVREMVDFGRYFSAVSHILGRHLHGREMVLSWEPGRIVFAAAGFFITEVLEVRTTGLASADVYVDGSFTNIPTPKIRNRQNQVLVLGAEGGVRSGTHYQARICGATTLSTDQLLPKACPIPQVHLGDLLVILDAGAYGHAGSYNFLGKSRPPEVMVDGSGWSVVRSRQREDHMLEGLG